MDLTTKLLIFLLIFCVLNKSTKSQEIAYYEEIKDAINHPEKLLIDLRESKELEETGKFPNAILIPVTPKPLNVTNLDLAFNMNSEDFTQNFHHSKPTFNETIIFVCKKGYRAKIAAEKAIGWGYTNVKYYKGSWNEWCIIENLRCYENP